MHLNHTELVFILDRSGSMGGLEGDTIGGFNSLLRRQQAEPGECRVTTVLFDDKYELLHDRLELRAVAPITVSEYYVRGSTALLDAIGATVSKISAVQARSQPAYRAGRVLFVITTDGMENASREYSYHTVRAQIERQKAQGWEFLFLGANIDAVEVAGRFGVARDRAQCYHADSEGVRLNYEVVSEAVSSFRGGAPLVGGWNKSIEKDFSERRKK